MLGTANIKLRTIATDVPFVNWLRSVTFFSRSRGVIPKNQQVGALVLDGILLSVVAFSDWNREIQR